jgi:hypothetical protein
MKNRPYGNELLEVARRTLLDELLPLLPAEKTYEALMVANAMAIAARELAPHATEDEAARQAIRRFHTETGRDEPTEATEHELAALIRDRAIREPDHLCLQQLLLALTRAKLSVCNPKYLGG